MLELSYADLVASIGGEPIDLGASEWTVLDQDRVDSFAKATGDRQWIHVDQERAAKGPYGTTIVHGLLVLSLVAGTWSDLIAILGAPLQLNYGLNRVRFIAPVPVDSRARVKTVIDSVTPVEGGLQLGTSSEVEIEEQDRPALVASSLYRVLEG